MDTGDEHSRRVHEYYRRAVDGHVYIRETLELLFATVAERFAHLGPKPQLLELGSHGGFITEALLQRWPDLDIVVSDENTELVDVARRRLEGRNVRFDSRPLDALSGAFDLVVSVARHHHLPHGYLSALRGVMRPHSSYILADELCPEYCREGDLARLDRAEILRVAGGYVFTSETDWHAFEQRGVVPAYALELEDLRRRALWAWYRFVVDSAIDRGYFDIAAGELQSARDDLVTGSAAEHKFSPAIVEREFELSRFYRISKRLIGPPDEPTRQGMFVYEFGRA